MMYRKKIKRTYLQKLESFTHQNQIHVQTGNVYVTIVW
jgi:hypothetical protein